ncbi:MAG: SH3 domain-containing protein, partial [Phototrophicaceae bacterium]
GTLQPGATVAVRGFQTSADLSQTFLIVRLAGDVLGFVSADDVVVEVFPSMSAEDAFPVSGVVATTPVPTTTTASRGTITATANVNVRAEPSQFGERVGVAAPNDVLEVITPGDDWVEVRLPDGTTGFVAANFIRVEQIVVEVTAVPTEVVAAATEPVLITTTEIIRELNTPPRNFAMLNPAQTAPLPIYSGPDVLFNVLGELAPGVRVIPLGANPDGSWVSFRVPAGQVGAAEVGWIQAEFMAVDSAPNGVEYAYVSLTGVANNPVYTSADPASEVLDTFPQDAQLVALGVQTGTDSNEWYLVRLPDGRLGFTERTISQLTGDIDAGLSNIPRAIANTGAAVPLVDAPSEAAAVVDNLAVGVVTDVLALAEDGDWVQVLLPDGRNAYAPFEALALDANITERQVLAGVPEPVAPAQLIAFSVPSQIGAFSIENAGAFTLTDARRVFAVRLGLIVAGLIIAIGNIFAALGALRERREKQG